MSVSVSVQCGVLQYECSVWGISFPAMALWIGITFKRRLSTHLQHHWSQGIFVNHALACRWDISLLYLLLICCCSFLCWKANDKKFKRGKNNPNLHQLPMVHRKNIFEIGPHRSFVMLTRHLTSIFSGYKANTFCPFVRTCCHGSNTSTEQWAEWKVAVNVCVGAPSCHTGGSPWMDCIVVQKQKQKSYYGNTDSVNNSRSK